MVSWRQLVTSVDRYITIVITVLVTAVTYLGFEYRSVHDGDRRGFTVKPTAKYVDECLDIVQLQHAKAAMTPLTEQKSLNLHDETTPCDQVQHSLFRSVVGKLQYITRRPVARGAWLLLLCLTRDRHRQCLPSLLFVMVTTAAANAHAKASPPFLVSCATLRISTQAPPWMRLRALCSPRLSGSRARLPLVVASGEWELGFAIGVVRPVRPGLPGWVTSLWAPLARLSAVRTRLWSTLMSMLHPSLTVDLPGDFTQRIRALPSNTILHVPVSCRLRMISAVAQCWNGMAQGRDDYAQLEECRSKLQA